MAHKSAAQLAPAAPARHILPSLSLITAVHLLPTLYQRLLFFPSLPFPSIFLPFFPISPLSLPPSSLFPLPSSRTRHDLSRGSTRPARRPCRASAAPAATPARTTSAGAPRPPQVRRPSLRAAPFVGRRRHPVACCTPSGTCRVQRDHGVGACRRVSCRVPVVTRSSSVTTTTTLTQ